MAKPEAEKRPLKFNALEEMLREANSLAENGYSRTGNWTLGQACGHIANWMTYPIEGFPKTPLVMKPLFWLMKVTMGPKWKRDILANGFKGGMPTAPVSVPAAESADSDGIEQLSVAIEKLKSHTGDLLPSPLFGPMEKEILVKVSLLHAEHHLGYFQSKDG